MPCTGVDSICPHRAAWLVLHCEPLKREEPEKTLWGSGEGCWARGEKVLASTRSAFPRQILFIAADAATWKREAGKLTLEPLEEGHLCATILSLPPPRSAFCLLCATKGFRGEETTSK